MPAAKANSVLAGERVITRGAASSHAGEYSSAASAKDSDLATCQVLYQILHHQGGLSGGDRKELLKAEVGLLVGHVGDSANHHEGNLKVMADVGDGGRFHFHGDRLREVMADLRQTDRAVNEGIPANDEAANGVKCNALMQLSAAATSFSSALKPAGQPGSWPYS